MLFANFKLIKQLIFLICVCVLIKFCLFQRFLCDILYLTVDKHQLKN